MAYITINFNTGVECTSGWTAPPFWDASTSYTAEWGQGVKPTTPNGHHYLCTSAGTSGSSDPFSDLDKNWVVIYDGSMQWTCFDEFANPTIITSHPFGHGFVGSLWYMYYMCSASPVDYIDSTYLIGSTYDVNTLSSQHEVATIRYRIYGAGDLVVGHNYTVKETWKDDGGNTIFYHEYTDPWQAYTYLQTGAFVGWTPCWWWSFGSKYAGYEEITEGLSTGTDYTITVEVYDGSTQICYKTETFTVKNLHHTSIYWDHIQDFTGAEVGGDFGMKASEYVHDLGTDTWITAWYRQKNLGHDASIKVDGMKQYVDGGGTTRDVDLQAYRSGYVKQIHDCNGVVDKSVFNGPYDFTGADYLQASIEGTVQDVDGNPLENANVQGQWGGTFYGAKTSIDGKYVLPLHTGGTYQIKAIKNNHVPTTHPNTVMQSGKHPTSRELRDFTGTYKVERRTDYPQGTYAHTDSLAVDKQSVIIPDEQVTGDGDLIII